MAENQEIILDISCMKSHIDLPFIIVLTTTISMLLAVLIYICISYLNNSRFKMVCDLYERDVGPLPMQTIIFKNSSTVGFIAGYTQKMMFIMNPLIYKKNSFLNKAYSLKHYEFINKLPKNIKIWFYVEYISFILIVISFCLFLFSTYLERSVINI